MVFSTTLKWPRDCMALFTNFDGSEVLIPISRLNESPKLRRERAGPRVVHDQKGRSVIGQNIVHSRQCQLLLGYVKFRFCLLDRGVEGRIVIETPINTRWRR